MSFALFAADVVADYWAARTPLVPDNRLTRCTARVTSSLAEERLAHLLLLQSPDIEHIYVDCRIYPAPGMDGQMRKPDLVVKTAGEIKRLVDVKMDMGYMRQGRLMPLAENAAVLLHNRGRIVRVAGEAMQMAERCKYVLLVPSGLNIDAAIRDAQIAEANNLDQDVAVRVLWPNHHPNSRDYHDQATLVSDLIQHATPGVPLELAAFCA
jgi:hypothetical protein